jgi:hypothetical protein
MPKSLQFIGVINTSFPLSQVHVLSLTHLVHSCLHTTLLTITKTGHIALLILRSLFKLSFCLYFRSSPKYLHRQLLLGSLNSRLLNETHLDHQLNIASWLLPLTSTTDLHCLFLFVHFSVVENVATRLHQAM